MSILGSLFNTMRDCCEEANMKAASNRSSSDLFHGGKASDMMAFKKRFDNGDAEARKIVRDYKRNH